jgi:hypothetical protein
MKGRLPLCGKPALLVFYNSDTGNSWIYVVSVCGVLLELSV